MAQQPNSKQLDAHLYDDTHFQRMLHRAVDIALKKGAALTPPDFFSIDMLHYLQEEGLTDAIKYGELGSKSRVLDIGSGAGGPARYVSWKTGCSVTGVEIQQNLVNVAYIMNRLLSTCVDPSRIQFLTCDITKVSTSDVLQGGPLFTMIVSQLCMLHISDKDALFSMCGQLLGAGGHFYLEEYCALDNVAADAEKILEQDVSVPHGHVLTRGEFATKMEHNGLIIEQWEDITDQTVSFVWARCEKYLKDRKERRRAKLNQSVDSSRASSSSVQDEELDHEDEPTHDVGHFYIQIAKLFHGSDSSDFSRSDFPNVMRCIGRSYDLSGPQTIRCVKIKGVKK